MLRPPDGYGDSVPYLLPRLDSPVIGAADDSDVLAYPFDQRHIRRPGIDSDLGAVEVQVGTVLTTDGGSGAGSLGAAITRANDPAEKPLDYVDLRGVTDSYSAGGPIVLTADLPEITRRAIFVGMPRFREQIEGNDVRRIFNIAAGAHVTLENLTLSHGNSAGDGAENAGGAILNRGNLTVRRCYFVDNSAGCGGAIRNHQNLVVDQSSFADSEATADSGAIENLGGLCNISNTTFHANSAGNHGGALGYFQANGLLFVDQCTLCENESGADGDGLYNQAGFAEVLRSIVSDCGRTFPNGNLVNDFGGILNDIDNFTGSNPKLEPLADDFFTPSRTPQFDSPVVDALAATRQSVDQNGRARSENGASDTGAIERYDDPYRAWTALYFDAFTLADDARRFDTWDPFADPDRDQVNNIREALGGSHPLVPDAHLQPRSEVLADRYLSMQVRRGFLEPTGYRSTDLRTWSTTGVVRQNGDLWAGAPTYFFRSTGMIGAESEEFLRLQYDGAGLVPMAYVTVGDAGNPQDPDTGWGAVSQIYRIGKYEVTNHAYAMFLNAVDPAGGNALGLYASAMGTSPEGGITRDTSRRSGRKYAVKPAAARWPVNFVSWFSALRFCNWLHHRGVPGADTENGAYALGAATIARNPAARVALPTLDEWFKAAYYTGSGSTYNLYPMGGVAAGEVNNNGPPGDGNSANYDSQVIQAVGSYTSAPSDYGTYDQGGNLAEWTETSGADGVSAFVPGGDFLSESADLQRERTYPQSPKTNNSSDWLGFRVVLLR